jgi:hypothetical protein
MHPLWLSPPQTLRSPLFRHGEELHGEELHGEELHGEELHGEELAAGWVLVGGLRLAVCSL